MTKRRSISIMSGFAGGGMLWQMVAGAGIVVKLVLAGLFFLSIFSWAIILFKISALRRIEKETNSLYDFFWKNKDLSAVHAASKNYPSTPLSKLIQEVYPEVALLIEAKEVEGTPAIKTTKTKSDVMAVVKRLLKKTSDMEKAAMEKSVPFLATTGNTAPFVGLFGTVWGIMNTFTSIGMRGTANITTVAPGIAEALIATAMGLIAAIPAVVGYNHLTTRIERVSNEMESFSADLLNHIERKLPRD